MNNNLLISRNLNIEEAWKKVLNEVRTAAGDPGHPFRYTTLATVDQNASPRQRIVILRGFENGLEFLVYTDKRSGKVHQIRENNSVSLLFYDDQNKLQLLVNGDASIITEGPVHEKHWENHGRKRAHSFTSVLEPGTPIGQPEDAYDWDLEDNSNFCLISIRATEMEFLQLDGHRHIRGLKEIEGRQQQNRWIAP